MKTKVLLTISGLLLVAGTTHADTLKESYVAVLSGRDHFNSNGDRLTSVAAIIRQDRANFHKFNKRDAGDTSDGYFDKASNRDVLEKLLERGSSTAAALKAIVDGTPVVTVKIYTTDSSRDYVNVSVVK